MTSPHPASTRDGAIPSRLDASPLADEKDGPMDVVFKSRYVGWLPVRACAMTPSIDRLVKLSR